MTATMNTSPYTKPEIAARYLEVALQSIQRAQDFTQGMGREVFMADRKTQLAVAMSLKYMMAAWWSALNVQKDLREKTDMDQLIRLSAISSIVDQDYGHHFLQEMEAVWQIVQDDMLGIRAEFEALVQMLRLEVSHA